MFKASYIKSGRIFRNYLSGISSLFYPSKCSICYTDLPNQHPFICPICQEDFHKTHFEKYEQHHPASILFWGRIELEHVFCFLHFKETNNTRDIIHKIKYKEGRGLAEYMGEQLGKVLNDHPKYSDIEAFVPIPLHAKKEFIRGYNQSWHIANGLSKAVNTPIIELLKRRKHHDSQTKKNRFERYENVKDIFDLSNTTDFPTYQHIAIVDDVLTTGSTIESAYRTLKLFYPELKISVITIGFAGK